MARGLRYGGKQRVVRVCPVPLGKVRIVAGIARVGIFLEPGKVNITIGEVPYIIQVVIRNLVKGAKDRGRSTAGVPEDPAVIVIVHLLGRPAAVMAVKTEVVRLRIETSSDSGIKIGCKKSKRCRSATDRGRLRPYYACMHLMAVGTIAYAISC